MANNSSYYNELKNYYTLYDEYMDFSKDITEEEEDKLLEALDAQENKVIDILYDVMQGKTDKKTIKNMLAKYRDRLLELMKNYK